MEFNASPSPHRIALVSAAIPMGGSTTFLINLAGELVRRGIPVEVLSLERENPLAADFQKQNIPVCCLDQRRVIFEDRVQAVLRRLARFQPTVVVATLGATSFEVLRYLPKGVLRLGMAQSDDPLVYDMMRHYTPWLDLAVVVSQAMRPKLEILPEFARVPVTCLLYGVPICADSELPAREPGAPLRILYLGRLGREQKRVHLFPVIWRQLVAAGIPFHWTIAGDGEERGFLEANLKPGTPNQTITFTGLVPYAEVPALLRQHDISLLTSTYEGFGLSIAEAMSYGQVPVVSDLPAGIPEMVNAANGMLVPMEDVAGYARAIIHLHEHRDELAAKSAAARAGVQTKFSVAAMADRWLAALPAVSAKIEPWPEHWKITGPLTAANPGRFSPPLRLLRRLAARCRRIT